MYYIHTTQADTNNWQRTYQVQNWQHHRDCDRAASIARYWAHDRDWDVIDTQHMGHYYKVHLRDNHGHFRTIIVDRDFHVLSSENRYC